MAITYQPRYRVTGNTTWTNLGSPISSTTVGSGNVFSPSTGYDFSVIGDNGAGQTASAVFTFTTPARGSNLLTNSILAGSVAGSPGTYPTNWTTNGDGGLTRTIVGAGIDPLTGMNYLDVRWNGTNTGQFTVMQPSAGIAMSGSQANTFSCYVYRVGGSNTNLRAGGGFFMDWDEAVAGPSAPIVQLALTTSPQRCVLTATTASGTTSLTPYFGLWINATSGLAVDCTIRVMGPQLEHAAAASTYTVTPQTP